MRKVYSNFCPPPVVRQDFGTVDLCEPDTTMTIAEIIDAYRNGQLIEADDESTYDGDDDFDEDGIAPVYDDVLDAIDHAPSESKEESKEEPKEEPKEELKED